MEDAITDEGLAAAALHSLRAGTFYQNRRESDFAPGQDLSTVPGLIRDITKPNLYKNVVHVDTRNVENPACIVRETVAALRGGFEDLFFILWPEDQTQFRIGRFYTLESALEFGRESGYFVAGEAS